MLTLNTTQQDNFVFKNQVNELSARMQFSVDKNFDYYKQDFTNDFENNFYNIDNYVTEKRHQKTFR